MITTRPNYALEAAQQEVERTDQNILHHERMPYVPRYQSPVEQMEGLIKLVFEHADFMHERQLVDEARWEASLGIAMQRTMEMFGR